MISKKWGHLHRRPLSQNPEGTRPHWIRLRTCTYLPCPLCIYVRPLGKNMRVRTRWPPVDVPPKWSHDNLRNRKTLFQLSWLVVWKGAKTLFKLLPWQFAALPKTRAVRDRILPPRRVWSGAAVRIQKQTLYPDCFQNRAGISLSMDTAVIKISRKSDHSPEI